MSSLWTPPSNYRARPVVVIGAGVLGRRIAACWVSGGYDVNVRDPSPAQREACLEYVEKNMTKYTHTASAKQGTVRAFEDLKTAVQDAWLVIEAVPEKLELKLDTFADLETLAPIDAILATNSSSYKSSEMLNKVSATTKARILNTHYYMPPAVMVVELMTDGHTESGIFPFMVDRQKEAGTIPFVARKESTGFIFNRLWAAVKRESLMILAEGVSVPEEIDAMWSLMFSNTGKGPCQTMDSVGLDTVALIEDHFIKERHLPTYPVDWLRKEYINEGKLGAKSENGGFYSPSPLSSQPEGPKILALDIGLSASAPSHTGGRVLELSADGAVSRVILDGQCMPDGIDVDATGGRFYFTCMGIPGKQDGAVYSAKLDGSDIQSIVAPGTINTPKQLVVEPESKKLYFCDREGLSVMRCNYDGSELETLISTGASGLEDQSKWCVGICVAPTLGKFYWTQKGPSKSGRGRIFCANITTPSGQTATTRTDICCLISDLPEPIDLELEPKSKTLYWTDRGELPFGNSLNSIKLDGLGYVADFSAKKILTKGFHEAIGLKLDASHRHIYVTDLGGSIYRMDMDGSNRTRIFEDDAVALTGITLM